MLATQEMAGWRGVRMLVLDRKVQEGFWIGGRIYIKVLSIGRRRVKIGVEAPADLEVLREELQQTGMESRRGQRVS